MIFKLAVIVKETDRSHPHCCHKHQYHVYVRQVSQQQAWNENGHYDDYSSHGRSAGFLHLSFETEVSYYLAHLHTLQPLDYLVSERKSDDKRHGKGYSGAE
ncbi:hypothetical protein IMSAGC016_01556 [Muribaculaceae bacterium]|nr:hypothetical protein IMSAGC016_01556 [Muribaculaceae bacterium]